MICVTFSLAVLCMLGLSSAENVSPRKLSPSTRANHPGFCERSFSSSIRLSFPVLTDLPSDSESFLRKCERSRHSQVPCLAPRVVAVEYVSSHSLPGCLIQNLMCYNRPSMIFGQRLLDFRAPALSCSGGLVTIYVDFFHFCSDESFPRVLL